jgi:hypothetical protein
MGSLRQLDLLHALVPDNPDDAHPIGAAPKQQSLTACRVGPAPDGTLVVDDEVPIRVAWDVKEERLSTGKNHRWWRYEAKVDPREIGIESVRSGNHFVMSEHPYGIERVHHAPFKRGLHRGPEDRPSLARRCVSAEELLRAVEALDSDYWEKGKVLTAGLSNPETTMRPDGSGRRYHQDALYVLGICDDVEQRVRELSESKEANELRRLTANRTIRIQPVTVNQSLRLYDEVAEQGPALLLLSIGQALAGPHEDWHKWQGQPVMRLADYIYRDHLNSYNRRVRRRIELPLGKHP